MFHPTLDTAKGLCGLCGVGLAQLTAFQTDVEWGLRILLGILSIVIAVLTIRSMIRPRRGRD
jgi:hypothetical protein